MALLPSGCGQWSVRLARLLWRRVHLLLYLHQDQVAPVAGVPPIVGRSGSCCAGRRCSQGREVVVGAVTAALFRDGLCLPSGTALTAATLERVVPVIHRARG